MLLTRENVVYHNRTNPKSRSTLTVIPTRTYPMPHVRPRPVNAASQAGGLLITETIRTVGLDQTLGEALAP